MATRWLGAGKVDEPVSGWTLDLNACSASAAPEVLSRATASAVGIVWNATCRRFPGPIEVAVRYLGHCAERVISLHDAFAYPLISVDRIVAVDSAGAESEYPTSSYRVDGDVLVKHNVDDWTGSTFPANDRFRPHDYQGQWWIEATIGAEPPAHVVEAARQLGCEFVLATVDPEKCSLPDNIASITRQGTTIEFDRTQWAALPLLQEITRPWPIGYGCPPAEYGLDPARGPQWAEIPWALVAPGS